MERSRINPWMRADLHRLNEETLSIVPDEDKDQYVTVMTELADAEVMLSDANERYRQALLGRERFMQYVLGQWEAAQEPQEAQVLQLPLPTDSYPVESRTA
jgi:hypothetical protein